MYAACAMAGGFAIWHLAATCAASMDFASGIIWCAVDVTAARLPHALVGGDRPFSDVYVATTAPGIWCNESRCTGCWPGLGSDRAHRYPYAALRYRPALR